MLRASRRFLVHSLDCQIRCRSSKHWIASQYALNWKNKNKHTQKKNTLNVISSHNGCIRSCCVFPWPCSLDCQIRIDFCSFSAMTHTEKRAHRLFRFRVAVIAHAPRCVFWCLYLVEVEIALRCVFWCLYFSWSPNCARKSEEYASWGNESTLRSRPRWRSCGRNATSACWHLQYKYFCESITPPPLPHTLTVAYPFRYNFGKYLCSPSTLLLTSMYPVFGSLLPTEFVWRDKPSRQSEVKPKVGAAIGTQRMRVFKYVIPLPSPTTLTLFCVTNRIFAHHWLVLQYYIYFIFEALSPTVSKVMPSQNSNHKINENRTNSGFVWYQPSTGWENACVFVAIFWPSTRKICFF